MKPTVFCWDGNAMVPHRTFDKLCAHQFIPGENYRLVQHEDRSDASHRQFFASLHDKWMTLPETLQDEYPSEESLRHKALIRCGYCTEKDFILPSETAALTFAAALIEDDAECYLIIECRGRVVRKYKAASQAYRAMGKKVFQKSKQDVLDFVDRLLGVEPQTPLPATRPTKQIQGPPTAPADEPAFADCQRERV